MFINTKNNTLAAIISLSLLMASMPVKAENNANEYAKKTARCAWHVAKVVTGFYGCIVVAGSLSKLYSISKEEYKTEYKNRIIKQYKLSENDAASTTNNAIEHDAKLMKINLIGFIPAIAAIKSGIDGLAQECGLLSQEGQAKEDNENQSMKNNFS